MSNLEWHFMDYPTDSEEQVLVKMTDGEIAICEYDTENGVWLDVGRDRATFEIGVACWARIFGIPETDKQMPLLPFPKARRN